MSRMDTVTLPTPVQINRSLEMKMRRWGQALVARSEHAFSRSAGKPLARRVRYVSSRRTVPMSAAATAWDQGLFILMLAAGAHHYPADAILLHRYPRQLKPYWRVAKGIGGYNADPGRGPLDRYYDDNEWITWGLLLAYRVTHDPAYLSASETDFRFVLSGRNKQLGGGIFWHEQAKNYKNTCANAPAIIDALQLLCITHDLRFLRIAKTIYHWVNTHLQSPHHLFYDGERLNGTINKKEWSYNAGAMLTANCLFYNATHRRIYLDRAYLIAAAAQNKWITSDGGVRDIGPFAWVLLNGYLHLYRVSHRVRWLRTVIVAMLYLHRHCKDPKGLYGHRWDEPARRNHSRSLLDQAAAGIGFFQTADAIHIYLRINK